MIAIGRPLAVAATALCVVLAGPVQAGQSAASTSAAQSVRIKSEPGVVLAGELFTPPAAKAPAPAVLLPGGGGASPHGIYPLPEAKLHAKGIATLSFDKRGARKATRTCVDALEPMTRDAHAVLAYLKSRNDIINTNRIAILVLG